MNTLQNTPKEKSQSLGFLQKKPSINESIQSKDLWKNFQQSCCLARTYKIIKRFLSISFMGPFRHHFIMCVFTSQNSIHYTKKWHELNTLFHYRIMKQQFYDSVIKYDLSIMPCFDIVVPHYFKVVFRSKYYVEKLILPQWSLQSDLEGTCH